MPPLVTSGASLQCSFGLAPSTLTVPPTGMTAGDLPLATINNFAPMANIAVFGMCTTQSNPTVAAATAAAMGTPTPAPCVPATTSPWTPGSAVTTIQGLPALTSACTCNCMWGGVISITSPGQTVAQSN